MAGFAAARLTRVVIVLSALIGVIAGCNRAHYRRQADEQAYALIEEKTNNSHWDLQDYEIYIDPRSRMFDPFDPDVPPLPPDDPASHEYMHEVYGMKGYPGWHYSGETSDVENPAWYDYLPVDEDGVLRLNSRLAHQLGRIHSRNYQGELEELYLSALDVSFERFRFDSQFFAGYQLFSTWDGADRRGSGGESRSLLTASTYSAGRNTNAWTMQRSFATGGDLVAGFANSLVWQFAGPNDYAGTTLLDFSLLQPLLRGAGRDRILERLTISERTLLANVRAMERYRGAFFVDLMTGRGAQATDGPQRRGGVLGGSGLEGFSGVGAGGFGRLAATAGGGIGGGGATGAGAGQAGGFIGLLQSQQQIRNQEDNIARLRTNLYRLETGLRELLTTVPARQEQIPQQRLQVAQSRQALVLAESRLINARNAFEAQLDTYKGTLGLPPTVCIELSDPMLDQFQLISQQLQDQQKRIDGVIEDVGDTNDQILARVKDERDDDTGLVRRFLEWTDELSKHLAQLNRDMQPVGEIQKSIVGESFAVIVADLKRLDEAIPRRVAALERLQKKYDEQKDCLCPLLPIPSINPVVLDVERLKEVDEELREEFERLRKKFAVYDQKLADFLNGVEALRKAGPKLESAELFEKVREESVLASQNLLTDLRLDVLALELCQARIRTFTIELIPVEVEAPVAMEIASQLRHDLMNARAALVDSWRLIEFNADNLEGTLNVVFSGDLSNVGQNPLELRGTTGRMRAGLQFDAPIVRIAERNTYRQSLIEYQQARRNFYNSLDSLSRGLRSICRTIETNQFNFEIQRYAVLAAIEQIDLNEDIRVLNEALRQPTGVTAARDSVSALNDLLNAQNDFLSIWINYELQRLWLDLDMGTMQLDDSGHWIDPGPLGPEFIERVRGMMGDHEFEGEHGAEGAELLPPGPVKSEPDDSTKKGPARPEAAKTSVAQDKSLAKPTARKSRESDQTAKSAENLAQAKKPSTNTAPRSPKEARLNQMSAPAKASPDSLAKKSSSSASKVAATRAPAKEKEIVAPAPPSSYSLPAPPSLALRPRQTSVAAALPSSTDEAEEANEANEAKVQGTASKVVREPTLARRPTESSTVERATESSTATRQTASDQPTLASRPSEPEQEPEPDDEKPFELPRTVQVAPVKALQRETPQTPSDQPQPVTILPAAAIEPVRSTRPTPVGIRNPAPTAPPKTLRPGSARRIGG